LSILGMNTRWDDEGRKKQRWRVWRRGRRQEREWEMLWRETREIPKGGGHCQTISSEATKKGGKQGRKEEGEIDSAQRAKVTGNRKKAERMEKERLIKKNLRRSI